MAELIALLQWPSAWISREKTHGLGILGWIRQMVRSGPYSWLNSWEASRPRPRRGCRNISAMATIGLEVEFREPSDSIGVFDGPWLIKGFNIRKKGVEERVTLRANSYPAHSFFLSHKIHVPLLYFEWGRHQQRIYHWFDMCVHQWPLYDHRMLVDSQLIYTCHNTRFQIYSKNYFNSMITLQSISMYKVWFKKPCFRVKETERHFSTQRQQEARAVFTHSSIFSSSTDQRKPDPSSYHPTKHSTLLLVHRDLWSRCC